MCRLCSKQDGTALGNAPSMSRNRADVTLPTLQDALIMFARRCMASIVMYPGLPPKWFAGRSWCLSIAKVSWSTTTAVSTFHIVLRRAIGLYALGASYLGLPGFLSTTVVNVFQGLYISKCLNMALYMVSRLSVSNSAHFISTILGMPSGPGALYGFSLWSCFQSWSTVILTSAWHWGGYLALG